MRQHICFVRMLLIIYTQYARVTEHRFSPYPKGKTILVRKLHFFVVLTKMPDVFLILLKKRIALILIHFRRLILGVNDALKKE